MQNFVLKMIKKKIKKERKYKAQWICENQVSDIGPLGILLCIY